MLQKHSRLAVLVLSGSLMVGGILLILMNLNWTDFASPQIEFALSGVLLVGGIAFAWFYIANRSRWWQLIPSFTCLSLAAMLYMTTLDSFNPRLSAAVLLWGMALSFLLVYVTDPRDRWWGAVMAGLMFVLGLTTFLSSSVLSIELLGGILFGGLGLVFLYLFLQGDKSHFWWAPIPGFIMLLYGLFAFMGTRSEAWLADWKIWWPGILVLLGIFVIVSAYLFPRMYRFSPLGSGSEAGEEESSTAMRSTTDVLMETEGQVPGSSTVVLHELQH